MSGQIRLGLDVWLVLVRNQTLFCQLRPKAT